MVFRPASGTGSGKRKVRSAPKVHTGCGTCRRRKVKCDERKPQCRRCTKYGVECEGYRNKREPQSWVVVGLGTKSSTPSDRAKEEVKRNPASGSEPKAKPSPKLALMPTYGTGEESRALASYLSTVAVTISEFSSPYFWRILIPQASWTQPAIKHGLVALTMLQGSLKTIKGGSLSADERSMWHYNQTIKLLSRDNPTVEVALLTCFLFFTYENTQGNFKMSRRHIKGGIKIIKEWQPQRVQALNDDIMKQDIIPRFREGLEFLRACLPSQTPLPAGSVTARLPQSTIMVHHDRDIPDPPSSAHGDLGGIFPSIEAAYAAFYECVRRVLCPSTIRGGTLTPLLVRWKRTFDSSDGLRACDQSLLRFIGVHYHTCRIIGAVILHGLEDGLEDPEISFDAYLEDFRFIVDEMHFLVARTNDRALAVHYQKIGFIPPLFLTALKCRNSLLRWRAVGLLEQLQSREGCWTSQCAAKIARECINWEEEIVGPETAVPRTATNDNASCKRRLRKIGVEIVKKRSGHCEAWMWSRTSPGQDLPKPRNLVLSKEEIKAIRWPIADILDAYGYQDTPL